MKKYTIVITAFTAAMILSSSQLQAFNIKESFQRAKNYIYNKYIYSERYCIKKEEARLDKNLKTFVLDKNAPSKMHPDKHQYKVGSYEYWVETWYNRGNFHAIADIKFDNGPTVQIVKPVHYIDYTLLSRQEMNTLKDMLMMKIKVPELENTTASVELTNKDKKQVRLNVFFPSHGQKLNNAVVRTVNNKAWKALKEILLMHKPIVSLTHMETKPMEIYRVKNFDPVIKQIITGLKIQKFSYE